MTPLELRAGEREVPLSAVARLEAQLAADLPDGLSVRLTPQAPAAACPRPGEEVRLLGGGRLIFRGRVEEVSASLEAGRGSSVAFTARPEWVARARALPEEEEYREVTDAEAAARLADALGLSPHIDPTPQVHRCLARRGDPLEFLLRRARASGRAAAIASGTLHFASSLGGGRFGRFQDLGPGPRVRSWRVAAGSRGRRGRLAVLGVLDLFPLDRLLLRGFGRAADGLYRVARTRTVCGGGRVSLEVDFIEHDLELGLHGAEGDLGGVAGARSEAAS